MRGEPGFFDVDERLRRLSDLGDQLLAFTAAVDFEMFRPELTRALAYSDGSQGGRPPFDPVMMFRILVIQAANALSDERAEFLINDRLSFMRFLEPVRPGSRRPHDLAVPREADPGRGDQAAVRPVRRGAARGRVRRHGRPNPRVKPEGTVQKDKMDLFIRTVGIARARLKIGMANLVYNFRRLVYLDRIAAA